jgi:CheY-like chemotaxis protein
VRKANESGGDAKSKESVVVGDIKVLLLVEDEAIIALDEKRRLEARGHRVLQASSGEDAIELVRSGKEHIDLILMDIDLGPGMDGTDAAVEIMKERDLPIIFLSSQTEEAVIERTKSITSYGYVTKHSGTVILDTSIRMAIKLFQNFQREKAKETELSKRLDQLTLAGECCAEPRILGPGA